VDQLTARLYEIVWHIEQGETFENRREAVEAIRTAYRQCKECYRQPGEGDGSIAAVNKELPDEQSQHPAPDHHDGTL
jgi:hypothetical protein